MKKHIIYDCEICGCYHPWEFNGDCRDNSKRYASPELYAEAIGCSPDEIDVCSMDERVQADENGE